MKYRRRNRIFAAVAWAVFCTIIFTGFRFPVRSLVYTGDNKWIRYRGNPLWHGGEPRALADGDILKMWYGSTNGLNYATSPDGYNWAQYVGNPVFTEHHPAHGRVSKIDGRFYYYYVDVSTNDLYLTISTDGIHWCSSVLVFAHNTFVWETAWGNPYVWREGVVWHGLFEYAKPGSNWQISLFESANGTSWTLIKQQLASLQPGGAIGDAGGPDMLDGANKHNGLYYVWYHGNTNTTGLPTDIYYATSPDLINWTIGNDGNPILVHSGSTPEIDQVADPSIIEFHGKLFLYFTADDNTHPDNVKSAIEMAVYDALTLI